MRSDAARKKLCRRISEELRKARIERGLSMTEVATRSGLSQQMVSYVERGLRSPTLDTLVRITTAINLSLRELIERVDSNE